MPKAYKITLADNFQSDTFQLAPFLLDRQQPLQGMPQLPETKIFRARESVSIEDFQRYIIEHEMEEKAWGRYSTSVFQSYIRKENINAFHSQSNGVLLLSGRKRFVLDFCRKTKEMNEITIKLLNIDMGQLLAQLPHIKGVWFRFANGLIRASALMGANIEATPDFKKYSSEGDISTLSFFYDHNGISHPVMVVNDGTVVLYSNYAQVSDEIDLVMSAKNNLFHDIMQPVAVWEEKNNITVQTPANRRLKDVRFIIRNQLWSLLC